MMKGHHILQSLILFFGFLSIALGLSGCTSFQIQSIGYIDGTYKFMSYNIKTYMPKAVEIEKEYWHERKDLIVKQIH